MAFHPLFIDTDRGLAVQSASNGSTAQLPRFTQQDTLNLRITFLTGYSLFGSFTKIATDGLTVHVALGRKIGDDTVYYTQQFTWVASDDLATPYFEASLPLNTEAIEDLIGDEATAQAYFEVKLLDGGLPRTVLSELVTIHAAVIKDGGLEEAAVPTPLSAEAANATYLQRIIPCSAGNPLILANGSITMAVYVDTDGTFKTVRLT
jgi:hypothetical protein